MADKLPPEDRPDYQRPEYKAQAKSRRRSRDLLVGDEAIHAGGAVYLPKWPGEDEEHYAIRRTLTEVFGAYERTLTAAQGIVFAVPPALVEGYDPAFEPFVDDADGRGNALSVFAKDIFFDGLADGFAGILVDYPPVGDPSQTTLADAQARNLRAYFVPIEAHRVIAWRTARIGSREVLTMLAIEECHERPIGQFGVGSVDRYRIFRRTDDAITWELWEKVEDDDGFRVVQQPAAIVGPTEIPFVPYYARRPKAPLVARPPLDQLAALNIGHYRVSADHRYMMSTCHAPTLTISKSADPIGADGKPQYRPIKIGPNALLRLMGEETASYLQADPEALQSSEKTMERLQTQMAAMGMAFLMRDRTQRAETATGRRLDAASEFAILATAAFGLKDALEQAFVYAAQFLEVDKARAPKVTVTTTYDESRLDAQTITALSGLAKDGNLTVQTLLAELQRGGVLSEAIDPEQEALDAAAGNALRETALSLAPFSR